MNSFVSVTENDDVSSSIGKMDELLFSTSPDVFRDFYSVIDYEEENENNDIIRLKYKIVLKDIIIKHLEKQLKNYQYGHNMWSGLINSI